MTHIVDSSILLRQIDDCSADQAVALNATRVLSTSGEELRTFSQNMVEFWAVATRPYSANGLNLTPTAAEVEGQRLEAVYPRLPDSPGLYSWWVRIVNQFGVSGKPTHDARIAAAMLGHDITHILTFNVRDFQRYATLGIVAVDPASV